MEREVFDEAAKQFREDAECGALVRKHLSAENDVLFSYQEGGKLVVVAQSHFGTRWDFLGMGTTLQDAVSVAKGNK